MRSLFTGFVAVMVAVSAALAAMLLAALGWKITAIVVFGGVAVIYFVWRARNHVLGSIWPLVSLWLFTTVMMLSALSSLP
jgi:hypothetical protein